MSPSRTRTIVIAGVLSAITILLGVTRWGFIPWFGASLTFMPVPVIIGAVLEGPWVGAFIGLIFGVFSLIQASTPNSGVDPLFLNPLISVLPRLFIGPAAWLVWRAVKRWPVPGLVITGAAGGLVNTVLVLSMIGLLVLPPVVPVGDTQVPALVFLGGIAVSNGLPEAVVAALLTLAVVAAWKQIDTGRKGADL